MLTNWQLTDADEDEDTVQDLSQAQGRCTWHFLLVPSFEAPR